MKCTCLLLLFAVLVYQANCLPVLHLKLERVYFRRSNSFAAEKNQEIVYKFFYDSVGIKVPVAGNCCISLQATGEENRINDLIKTGKAFEFTIADKNVGQPADSLTIYMEAFENNKGDACSFDKGDSNFSTGILKLPLSKIEAGNRPDTFWINTDKKMAACFKILYPLAKPDELKIQAKKKKLLADGSYKLTSGMPLQNAEDIKYEWAYCIGDSEKWQKIQETVKPGYQITPAKDFFTTAIYKETLVTVKMTAFTAESVSEPVYLKLIFVPPPPAFSKDDIETIPGCRGAKNGKLILKNIKGINRSYKLIIRKGYNNVGACPDGFFEDCGDSVMTLILDTPDAVIDSLPAGDFTVLLMNSEENAVEYFNHVNVHFYEYEQLKMAISHVKAASCGMSNDGMIQLTVASENPQELAWTIVPHSGNLLMNEDTLNITGLKPGNYTISVKDKCGETAATRPIPVFMDSTGFRRVISITESSNHSNNGSFYVDVSNDIRNYNYKLYNEKKLVIEAQLDIFGNVVFDKLLTGVYFLEITDARNIHSCRNAWEIIDIK